MCCFAEKLLPQKISDVCSGVSMRGYFGAGLSAPHHFKRYQKRGEEYIVHGKPDKGVGYTLIKNQRNIFTKFELPANFPAFKTRLIGVRKIEARPFQKADELAHEFAVLVKQWKRETGFRSSLSERFTHPAYQRVMAMGKAALPFILQDLRDTSDHWFYALRFIVGKDIGEGAASVGEARAKWLEWGYKNDYL